MLFPMLPHLVRIILSLSSELNGILTEAFGGNSELIPICSSTLAALPRLRSCIDHFD